MDRDRIAAIKEATLQLALRTVPLLPANELFALITAATKDQKNVDAQIQEAVEAVAKARGTKLGNPRPNLAKAAAASAERAARFRTDVLPLLQSFRAGGTSYRRIAATLNERQIPTLNGPSWHAATVRGALLHAQ